MGLLSFKYFTRILVYGKNNWNRRYAKIRSPFVREMIEHRYVVTPQITPGHEWVFNDNENVIATEKLDGTDVSIVIFEDAIISVWNRTGRVPFINKGKKFIIDAIQNSYERGYADLPDGQWFGEVIGKNVQRNILQFTGNSLDSI